MASILDIPDTPSTWMQTFAIFIIFFFPALALVVIVCRDAGRLASRQFGLDDWLVTTAMVLSLAETVLSYFFIKTNFVGIHIQDVPPHDPMAGRVWSYAVQILYNPILALVKSSVLIFLLRLFGQKEGVRRLIIGVNTINLLQMTAVFFAILFQCQPIAFNWDPTIKGGRCVDTRILFTTTAAFNIFTDLVVLGLPLWILVDLKIPKKAKIGLLFVFLLGFLVTITSIVRMVIIIQASFGLVTSSDPTFNIGFVTSAIETNLAIVTASAPALRPFLRSKERGGWFPSFSFSFGRSRPDLEMADSSTPYSFKSLGSGSRGGRGGSGSRGASTVRSARGGGRGGKRGGSRRSRSRSRSRSGRKGKPSVSVVRGGKASLRSQTPRSSEEEAMTSNGIMRVSDIQREIDGLVKEMAGGPNSTSRGGSGGYGMEDAGVGGIRQIYPERYYSESVYPDAEYQRERDFNEERLSRYGERRFGVITPKSATPAKWTGRPF